MMTRHGNRVSDFPSYWQLEVFSDRDWHGAAWPGPVTLWLPPRGRGIHARYCRGRRLRHESESAREFRVGPIQVTT